MALAVETWELTKSFKESTPTDQGAWAESIVAGIRTLFHPPERKIAVDRISLSVAQGEFFGVIGANGAGKTSFLKMLACLLYPDSGGGQVNGFDLRRQPSSVLRSVSIAASGGWTGTLWQLSGYQNLLYHARLCGLSRGEAKRRTDYVLEGLQIAHKAHDHTWHWSAGERQKFNLAMTFMARTPLVILDEPTSYLDPRAARLVRDFVKEELNQAKGQTVIMSTHYLEEADLLCDRVAILRQGRLLACDTPAQLKSSFVPERILEVRASNYTRALGVRVKAQCGLSELLEYFEDVTTGQVKLRPKWPAEKGSIETLEKALAAEQVKVISVRSVDPTLDDVYFQLTAEKVQ